MTRAKTMQDQKNQKAFQNDLVKAIRTQDEKDRKQSVFAAIGSHLSNQGLYIDITALESYSTGAKQPSASQQELLNNFSGTTSKQIRKSIENKYRELGEYEKLKISYDTAMADITDTLYTEFQKLETRKNESIETFGDYADIEDIVDKQQAIARKGMQLQSEGLPDHEYYNVKATHEQLLQEIEQDTRDYSGLVDVGMTQIMQGISQIEATEQERVEYVNKGIAKAVVGAALILGAVFIVPTAIFIPSLAAIVFGSAALTTPVLLAVGLVGIALLPHDERDPKAQSTVLKEVDALSSKAMGIIDKSIETVKSLENIRTNERGM